METNCIICGKKINIALSRYTKSKTKKFTCSKKCMGISFKRNNNLICPVCDKPFSKKPSYINRTKDICCSYKCAYKLKEQTVQGESNPNKKYYFNENFFKEIDSEEKAWILGWIASDGNIALDGSINIIIHNKDIDVLYSIRNILCKELPIYKRNNNMCGISFCSKNMANDICKHLKISPGKKSDIVRFPDVLDNFGWHFLRGYIEGDGSISKVSKTRYPECHIASNSLDMLEDISKFSNIPCNINYKNKSISWYGINCLDLLGKIYDNCNCHMLRKIGQYYDWCQWNPSLKNEKKYIDKIFFAKTRKDAIFPSKQRISDSGYDLTLIEKIKQNGEVEFYDTGLKVSPPFGYYFDLVPRSSIIKSGYILANNIGIIDRAYVGNIIVALIKIDKSKPDLELPSRLIQLIPRQIQHFNVIEVDKLEETERNEGGFGSSGTK